MLNEEKEYKQYSYPKVRDEFRKAIESGKIDPYYTRLNSRNLKNGLTGIVRAMTCVARKELFSGQEDFSGQDEPVLGEKTQNRVTEKLRHWYGAKGVWPENNSMGWLSAYMVFYFLTEELLKDKPSKKAKEKKDENRTRFMALEPDMRRDVFDLVTDGIIELYVPQKTEKGFLDQGVSIKSRSEKVNHLCENWRLSARGKKLIESGCDPRLVEYILWQARIILNRQDLFIQRIKYMEASILDPWKPGKSTGEKTTIMKDPDHRITYDSIIADALLAGPLETRVFLVKKSIWDHTYYRSNKGKNTEKFVCLSSSRENSSIKKWKTRIVKAAAAILIKQEMNQREFHALQGILSEDFPVSSGYVRIVKGDLANWCGDKKEEIMQDLLTDLPEERSVSWIDLEFPEKEYDKLPEEDGRMQPVFRKESEMIGSNTRIKLDENWVRTFGICLVRMSDLPEWSKDESRQDYLYYYETDDASTLLQEGSVQDYVRESAGKKDKKRGCR